MSRTREDLARAAVTTAATIASFVATDALCRAASARHGPAILAAVLAMSLARRTDATDRRHLAIAPLTIAFAAVGASGVGWLLTTHPAFGAVVFIAGIALSIYVRNFADPWRRIGAAVALPLVAILVVPARIEAPGGPTVDLALVVAAAAIAFACVVVAQWLARAMLVPSTRPISRPSPLRDRAAGKRLTPTTRLAMQIAVSLACAFAIGFALFPGHWSWTVFTAFIVASGARARGDVAYKGVQRLAGAIAGTLVATVATGRWHPDGPPEAIAIFTVLFAGLALRERHYAYWAAAMTIVLAVLGGSGTSLDSATLTSRLGAIAIGAIVAVTVAWFVVPIKTTDVIRKRLSETLVALDELLVLAPGSPAARREAFDVLDARLAELERAGSPMTLHRRFVRGDAHDHPARWVADARRLRVRIQSFASDARDARSVVPLRRAIGECRRAIGRYRAPDSPATQPSVTTTLTEVFEALDALAERPKVRS